MKQRTSSDDHLTPGELVSRWKNTISLGTLANWRSSGQGPKFLKLGGRILYRRADVEEYETRQHRQPVAPARQPVAAR